MQSTINGLTKQMFNVVLQQTIERELIEHRGNAFTSGTSVIRQHLEDWQKISGIDIHEYINAYWSQVVNLSYVVADYNWKGVTLHRDDIANVTIVDEELITQSDIYLLAQIEQRDFDRKFSLDMNSGRYGKLD